MGSEEYGASQALTLLPSRPGPISPFSPLNTQANLVRESEKMVRDTATRLERAAGELGDLLVRAPTLFPFDCEIPH